MNVRFIHSALSPIGTESEQGNGIASTVSVDLALMYRPTKLEVPLLGDIGNAFSVGVNLSNLGPKVTYVDADQADPLPTNLRVGLGYKLLNDEYNNLQLGLDFSRLLVRRREDQTSDPFYKALLTAWGDGSGLKKVIVSGGAEYWYGAPRLIALRLGYFYENPNYGEPQVPHVRCRYPVRHLRLRFQLHLGCGQSSAVGYDQVLAADRVGWRRSELSVLNPESGRQLL